MGKTKKLTPGGNWMWEDSRMMLPEHKLEHNRHQQNLKRREQKVLDEARWSEIAMLFSESLHRHKEIRVKLFDAFEELSVIGIVERIDQRGGQFMVNGDWFRLSDVEGAELEAEDHDFFDS
ncbi:YolD-like family protein [Paenibacillus sepulcri]